jgi:RNA polymerase sigma-70 factor (ECF subfamily)
MEQDEAALLAAARAGDRAAFERIVARHAGAVFRIAAGILGPDEAEDAAQEAFVRIHQGLARFGGEASLATWIYRIATNVALTRARRRRRLRIFRRLSGAPEAATQDLGPAENAIVDERQAAVRRAIAALPEKERAVVILRGIEGLSFDEVARALGIKRPTAESRMARAKERLREALARWLGGGEGHEAR